MAVENSEHQAEAGYIKNNGQEKELLLEANGDVYPNDGVIETKTSNNLEKIEGGEEEETAKIEEQTKNEEENKDQDNERGEDIPEEYDESHASEVDSSLPTSLVVKEAERGSYFISHPDDSFIDLQAEEKSVTDVQRTEEFPVLELPFEDESDIEEESGEEFYRHLCKKLNVVPVTHFVATLETNTANLEYAEFGTNGLKAVADTLYHNWTIKFLSLKNNLITEEAACHLGRLFQEKNYTEINLSGCRLGPKGVEALRDGFIKMTNLHKLDLSKNRLGSEGTAHVAGIILETVSINDLNLSSNKLEEESAIILGDALGENEFIEHLNLSWNSLYFIKGITHFFKKLASNKRVTHLNLSWNSLRGRKTGVVIRKFLAENQTLLHMDLSSNLLEAAAIRVIGRGLQVNKTLQTLCLGYNPIKPEEANALLRSLMNPSSGLKELDLSFVWVNKEFLTIQSELLQVKDIHIKIGGVYENFIIHGPDVKELLLKRARFEAMKPKQKKRKRDFGHFLLQLTKPQMRKQAFTDTVEKEKILLEEDLVKELLVAFQGQKKAFVDVEGMREYYMKLYPDTKLPEPKPKKRKGRKKKKKAN